jgi:transcriptional regulator with XRE-family HTH domain
METLGEYLDRVMRQKNLTPKELAKRCKVTDSYIGRVRKGAAGNLTVQTMVTLAKGLEVNAHDIFAAASGVAADDSSRVDPLVLLDHIQKLLQEPTGLDVLRQWLQLSPDRQRTLLDLIDFLNQRQPKGQSKPHKK